MPPSAAQSGGGLSHRGELTLQENSTTVAAFASNGHATTIFPSHLAELRASGLTDKTIRDAAIYSEADRRKLAAIVNRKSWSAKLGSALVFPYHDSTGAVVLYRVKPERAPLVRGK